MYFIINMDHVQHLKNNIDNLRLRFEIISYIRLFFSKNKFTEVDTPIIVKAPGQAPNLSPMKLDVIDEKGQNYKAYLHTSPEYSMKKMLASGFDNIFSICKCFRNKESFGGLHNPEFTMIEWYRKESDMFAIMEDVIDLCQFIAKKTGLKTDIFSNWQKVEMKQIWKKYIDVNLGNHLDKRAMIKLCNKLGYNAKEEESYEELFYRIFLNDIEPNLKGAQIIYNYPAQMAALSKLSQADPRYAERFEVYIDNLELANAFSELTDSIEQKKRLEKEKKYRLDNSMDSFPIDGEFIRALEYGLPPCAGIALGIDRLVQVFLDCQNIDDVLVLPMSKIF
ncbi:MAG: EF-P lysine aminoacylase GenX [Candidatus Magasanikbacteria bacterium]|nr:EF-P lysine aminoacylase GenX [Candidatus Magasanikbacteria bacterium]